MLAIFCVYLCKLFVAIIKLLEINIKSILSHQLPFTIAFILFLHFNRETCVLVKPFYSNEIGVYKVIFNWAFKVNSINNTSWLLWTFIIITISLRIWISGWDIQIRITVQRIELKRECLKLVGLIWRESEFEVAEAVFSNYRQDGFFWDQLLITFLNGVHLQTERSLSWVRA